MRKLIEQANQHQHLQEQLFGQWDSLRRQIERARIVPEGALGVTGIAAAMERTNISQWLQGVDRQLEIAGERIRELSTFGALWSSAVVGAMEGLTVQSALNDAIVKALEEARTSLYERFRFPGFAELQKFQEQMRAAHARFATMQPTFEELQRALAAIHTPWIDSLNASRSFDSFASLAGLGAAVRVAPYVSATIETVRRSLGTWATVPKGVDEDSFQRDEFYQEHGLNSNLIALPEPAFTQTLDVTGVVAVETLVPDADGVEFDIEQKRLTPEERALFGRTSRAFQLMNVLETKIREFIHRLMTQHCGIGWEKGRAPENGKVLLKWEEKRQNALKNGESPLDLIYYADFTDYAKLITRRDNWREVFSAVFRDEDDVKISFKRLESLRVITMHSRPVTKGDLLTIGTETTRILTAIGVLGRT